MNKIIGPLFLAVMVVLCIVSWKNIYTMNDRKDAEYITCIEKAEKYESKKIYIDAIETYREALEMRPDNIEIAYKIAELYDTLGEEENYLKALREAYMMNPGDMNTCEILIAAALEEDEYDTAYADVQRALQQETCTGEWKEKMEDHLVQLHCMKDRQYYFRFDSIGEFAFPPGDTTSATVRTGDFYGVVDLEGTYILEPEYDDAGKFGSGYIPVLKDEEYFYVDTAAYRRRVPDFDASWLGSFSEGYAPFIHGEKEADGTASEKKGLYGYLDTDMNKYAVAFLNAGMFSNGYAAVQEQDGGWLLIDTSFMPAFEHRFEDILMDENGYATRYGVFWGKNDGLYYLCDFGGNVLSEGYEEVKVFASDEPCAVKTSNGLWGYVGHDGKLVTDGIYLDAKSYSCGYAPVKLDEREYVDEPSWCLIDKDGNIIYDEEYVDDMSVVSYAGSFVITLDDSIQTIWMHLYD